MRGLNKVTLIGNLGNDPNIQTLEGNIKVAKLQKKYVTEIMAEQLILLDKKTDGN